MPSRSRSRSRSARSKSARRSASRKSRSASRSRGGVGALYCAGCGSKHVPSAESLCVKTYRPRGSTRYALKGKCATCGTNQTLFLTKAKYESYKAKFGACKSRKSRRARRSRSRSRK